MQAQPEIRGFLPDTIGRNNTFWIVGRNLDFCKAWLGDSMLRVIDSLNPTQLYVVSPQSAMTDYVYVSRDGGSKVRSPKKFVVADPSANQFWLNFSSSYVSRGERLVVQGHLLKSKRDSIVVLYNDLYLPIEALYDDSLVLHVPDDALSGEGSVFVGGKQYQSFSWTVVAKHSWKHCTVSIEGFRFSSSHHRYGTVNSGQRFDSTWTTDDSYSMSDSIPVRDSVLSTSGTTTWIVVSRQEGRSLTPTRLQMNWDSSSVVASLDLMSHYDTLFPVAQLFDSTISLTLHSASPKVEPTAPIHYSFPIPSSFYSSATVRFQEREADHTGDHSWVEDVLMIKPLEYGRVTIELTP